MRFYLKKIYLAGQKHYISDYHYIQLMDDMELNIKVIEIWKIVARLHNYNFINIDIDYYNKRYEVLERENKKIGSKLYKQLGRDPHEIELEELLEEIY